MHPTEIPCGASVCYITLLYLIKLWLFDIAIETVKKYFFTIISYFVFFRDDDREYVLKVGETKQVELRIAVENRNGEDAHEAYLHLDMSKHLTYVGATRDVCIQISKHFLYMAHHCCQFFLF